MRILLVVILMQINLNKTQQIFPLLSPIFEHTSLLSPLQEGTLRKYSYNYQEFGNFRLENAEDEDYLLLQIQQLPQQHYQNDQQTHTKPVDPTPTIEQPQPHPQIFSVTQNFPLQQEKKSPQQFDEQLNSDSQKDEFDEKIYKDRPYTELQKLIQNLIMNFNKDQNQLKSQILKHYHQNQHQLFSDIISTLVKKFKKTKKTKQEMVKYCMRKAFKFIADKMKKNRTHNRDIDSCMKMYFSRNQSNNNFSIPFKKNSTEKTMNGSFLKRIFSSETFVEDYKEFLHEFHALIQEDNFRKIKYLGDLIDVYLKSDQRQKIESIKRLPWTQEMLDQTLQLSKTLLEYAKPGSPLCTATRRKQQ